MTFRPLEGRPYEAWGVAQPQCLDNVRLECGCYYAVVEDRRRGMVGRGVSDLEYGSVGYGPLDRLACTVERRLYIPRYSGALGI